MGKQAGAFDQVMSLRDVRTPAYRWLYDSLRVEILEGRLRPGARLPGTRDLASQYGLSRGTVVNAFEQLKSEGYIEGVVGSGTYVSKILPDDLLHVTRGKGTHMSARRSRPRRISDYGKRVNAFPGYEMRPTRAFRANLPALDLFPISLWTQITARRLRRASTYLLMGCDAMGYLPLREALAEYLSKSRGVKCVAEQVAIVSGVQEALDLAARICLNPGDRVVVENPGYTGAVSAFEAVGARIVALRVDKDGMIIPDSKFSKIRMVYVTPAHQFPLGVTMSVARRLELLEWARKSSALIFEDDYDSEYRYSGRPVPAMQGLDPNGLVLFAGTFSKVLFPSLRLGYIVIPADLLDYFSAALSITKRHAPLLEQAVLCDFITEGHFGRHLRRMRQVYAERLSVLLDAAQEKLAGLLEISNVEAGLQTVGWLRSGMDAEWAARAAASRNVEVIPLSRYGRGRVAQHGLQLGFAAIDAREIRRGVRELAIALTDKGRSHGSR